MDDFAVDIPQSRTVAVHVAGDPLPFAGAAADRVWVGVRGCCELFMALCENGTVRRWLADARKVGRGVGLATPFVVPQIRFDAVVGAIRDHSDAFDRVMTGDVGVAAAVARGAGNGAGIRVTWTGRVLNVAHAEYLLSVGIDSVRAISPVSTACKDINHTVDLEMPAFGRIPLAFMPFCAHRVMDREYECPGACVRNVAGDSDPIVLSNENGAVGLDPCVLVSRDFLDLSPVMKPFGRDTCAVVETAGLTPAEVADAVDALRHGEIVPTSRPLFVSEAPVRPLPNGV